MHENKKRLQRVSFAFPCVCVSLDLLSYQKDYILNEMKSNDNPVCKKEWSQYRALKKEKNAISKSYGKNYAIIPKHRSPMIHTKYKCSYLQPEMLTGQRPHLGIVLHGVKAVGTRGVDWSHDSGLHLKDSKSKDF